jgi:hypothetical protein
MKPLWASIFIALTLGLGSSESQPPQQIDTLTIKLDNLSGMKQRQTKSAEMRQFIWEHWIQRRSSSLFLTTVSKEGETSHAEYKIVLLSGNTLILKVTVVRDRIGYQGRVMPKSDGGYEAYTVERVLSKNPYGVGTEAQVTVLPSDAEVPATGYWLRFKGWGDALITYF